MTLIEISNYYPTHSTLCIEVVTCRDCGNVHRIPAPQLMLRLRHRWASHITVLRPRSHLAGYINIPPGLPQETIEVPSTSSHCQKCFTADAAQLPLFPEPARPKFIPNYFNAPRPVQPDKNKITPATLDEL